MKRIAILVAIALIPLSVYAYFTEHSASNDDYQAFSQQFQIDTSDHHQSMMFHHRDPHFGEFRHHTYTHEQHHQETGTECPGVNKGCEYLDGPARNGSTHWYPRYRHIDG
ncbi:MAG: hypothetical protein LUC43_00840 [Burkholderiales bacterium]|nr:hypothetical protein [Burkholderiales bacterium]